MRLHRQILSQGDRDSACFLYALANATMVLKAKVVREEAWSTMVHSLSDAGQFLACNTGTAQIDSDERAIKKIAVGILKSICPTPLYITVKLGPTPTGLALQLNDKTVLVVANKWHWFCVVDADQQRCYVACSAKLGENPLEYYEHISPNRLRMYNDVFPIKQLQVAKQFSLQITTEA